MKSLDEFAAQKLDDLEARALRRTLSITDPLDAVRVERDGQVLISFCSNDYLNLSQDPRVKARAAEADEEDDAPEKAPAKSKPASKAKTSKSSSSSRTRKAPAASSKSSKKAS